MAAKSLKMNHLGLLAAFLCLLAVGTAEESLSDKCAAEFPKVTTCLPFATAGAAAPSKECCGAVTDLRDSDPACLCYIIQQVHNSSNSAVKSMGMQESRLLQLPSACKLVNASVSECPRLLHLPPNSPDAAMFTNASNVVSAPGPSASTSSNHASDVSTSGTSTSTTTSHGFRHKPNHIFGLIAASITAALGISSHGGFPMRRTTN